MNTSHVRHAHDGLGLRLALVGPERTLPDAVWVAIEALHHASSIAAPQHQTHEVLARHVGEVGEAVDAPAIPQPVAGLVVVTLRSMAVARLERLGSGEAPRLSLGDVVGLRLGTLAGATTEAMIQKPSMRRPRFGKVP